MGRSSKPAQRTDALLLRRVALGEADLLVTLLTEARGVVSVSARAARKSARRFPALEPMHLLRVTIDQRPGVEIGVLHEASIARARTALLESLPALDAAGRALRWIRAVAPPHTPDPELWAEANALLDALDRQATPDEAARILARGGLRLLAAMGWALDFERCVACGRACEPGRPAYADPARGGLVCRACGGAPVLLPAAERERLARAASEPLGAAGALRDSDGALALALCDAAFAAHAGVDPGAKMRR